MWAVVKSCLTIMTTCANSLVGGEQGRQKLDESVSIQDTYNDIAFWTLGEVRHLLHFTVIL